MKKKFVSSLVFVILTAGFHARAQVGAVDNSVPAVEKFSYVCASDDENSSVVLKIKNNFGSDGKVVTGKVIVENGAVLGLNSEYTADVSFENSFYFNVTTYKLLDENKNALGDFTISKQNAVMTRGGNFCGRAGCDTFPVNPSPITTSSGLLKIYEKETSFTCQ